MPSKSKIASQKGFTLLEIILTLVAAGVMAVFYFHFMGTAMDFSWRSVELVEGEARAEGLMEMIIAEYVEQINLPPQAPPNDALTFIRNRESFYEDETQTDFAGTVTMEWITYDSAGNETVVSPGPTNNLKVTVVAPGSNFTTILTNSRSDTDNPIVYF